MNIICFGSPPTGIDIAWECRKHVLCARFSGEERHRRRLDKVAQLEHRKFAA